MSAAQPGPSYDPQNSVEGGLDAEVDRLERQAALTWADEQRVLAAAGMADARRLLEVGCAAGAVTGRLRQWLDATVVVSIDIDARLARRVPRAAGHLVAAGDGARLPVPDAGVDAVLVRYVLQHVPAPAEIVAELRRVLAPGGLVAVTDVDGELWGTAHPLDPRLVAVYRRVAQAQHRRGGDRLVARRVPQLLTAAGFSDVAVRPFATTSEGHPITDFDLHLGAERLLPLVRSEQVSLADYALAEQGWQRFRADPGAWVMLLGFTITARAPTARAPTARA